MTPVPEDDAPASPEDVMEVFMDQLVIQKQYSKSVCGFAPFKNSPGPPPSPLKLLLFSAPTSEKLSTILKTVLEIAQKSNATSSWDKITSLQDPSHPYRHPILCSTFSDLVTSLKAVPSYFPPIPSTKQKICFLITCQGTQYPKMASVAYKTFPTFRTHFDELDSIVEKQYGFSVRQFLHQDNQNDEWLSNPLHVLPSILLVELSLFKLFQNWGINPDYVLGMSFGDYGAAIVSGILSFEDGLKLIINRTKIMQENIQMEGFLALGMDLKNAEKYLERAVKKGGTETWYDIAAINSPKQTGVVARKKDLDNLVEMCKEEGILHFVVCPYHPYHSRLTLPMIPLFEEITSGIKYNSTSSSCKYISTVSGQVEGTIDSKYFLRHLKEPARLTSAVATAFDEGCTHFLEIGSHPLNCTMVQDMLEDCDDKDKYVLLESLRRKQDDSLSLLNTLGQLFSLGYGVQLVEE